MECRQAFLYVNIFKKTATIRRCPAERRNIKKKKCKTLKQK
jgi:hypothetical protein